MVEPNVPPRFYPCTRDVPTECDQLIACVSFFAPTLVLCLTVVASIHVDLIFITDKSDWQ